MRRFLFQQNWFCGALVMLLFYGCASSRQPAGLPIDEVAVDVAIRGARSKHKKPAKKAGGTVHTEKRSTPTPPTSTAKHVVPEEMPAAPHTSAAAVNKLLNTAQSYLGTPYKPGGTSRAGMDCSGFVLVSFREVGVSLPRTSREQSEFGQVVRRHEIQPGDLIFFATGKTGTVGHSALVLERNQQTIRFIHAANTGVRIDELSSEYWSQRYLKARRVIP